MSGGCHGWIPVWNSVRISGGISEKKKHGKISTLIFEEILKFLNLVLEKSLFESKLKLRKNLWLNSCRNHWRNSWNNSRRKSWRNLSEIPEETNRGFSNDILWGLTEETPQEILGRDLWRFFLEKHPGEILQEIPRGISKEKKNLFKYSLTITYDIQRNPLQNAGIIYLK